VLSDKLAGGTKDDKILRIIPGITIQIKKCKILVHRRCHAVRQEKYVRKQTVNRKALKFGYLQRHDIHTRTHENKLFSIMINSANKSIKTNTAPYKSPSDISQYFKLYCA